MFGIKWDKEKNKFLFKDQTLLPHEELVVETSDYRDIIAAIKKLAIRGAPAIGVAGAFACYLSCVEYSSTNQYDSFLTSLEEISTSRPTAVNLSWAVSQVQQLTKNKNSFMGLEKEILELAGKIARDDQQMCESMAKEGIIFLKMQQKKQKKDGGLAALTHCNTGCLVTYGIGTALGILRKGFEKKIVSKVFACEARPLGQGTRLTMWELEKLAIPSVLICDSAAGYLMSTGQVDFVITGADRIARNGDTANKVGTLNLAILAKHFGIPMYIAAPSSTFDPNISTGQEIIIEQRHKDEVCCWGNNNLTSPKDIDVLNPAFDVTPGTLISAFFTEKGLHFPPHTF